MVKKNIVSSLIILIIAAIVLPASLSLGFNSKTADGVPGAGFFPTLISIAIIFIGLFTLLKSFLKLKQDDESEMKKSINKKNLFNTLGMLGFIVIYVGLWKFVGFYIATFISSLLMNLFLKRTAKFSLIFSAIFVALLYVVFTVGLRIQFVM